MLVDASHQRTLQVAADSAMAARRAMGSLKTFRVLRPVLGKTEVDVLLNFEQNVHCLKSCALVRVD